MKSTGIIRRIDDLGRVVIPKEIRRTTGIEYGDPLEIFMVDGMVCFKKYVSELETEKSKIIEHLDKGKIRGMDTNSQEALRTLLMKYYECVKEYGEDY